MSQDTTAPPAGQRGGVARPQASIRDHLNQNVAPYLKKALIKGLYNDVDYPLQWLGEHLIHLSMLHEGNPDSTNIKSHFKYKHDAPPQTQQENATTPIKTEERPREDTVITNGSTHANETEYTASDIAIPAGASVAEDAGAVLPGTPQDTEMQGGT